MVIQEISENARTVEPARYREILDAFTGVATRATESVDLDEILHLVAACTCELIGVKRCSVYLRGEDGLLHGQVGHTPNRDIDDRIKALVAGVEADRFTREMIETRAPVLVTDARNDPRTIRSTMRRWKIRDMLAVPLLFDGEVIGAIYLDNLDEEHVYSGLDIEVARTFASLAALAIRQTWLFTQVARRASVIERQKQVLERLSQVHSRLTGAVVSGADVPAILRLLVDLVDKPVVLYSEHFEVIAWAAPERLQLHEPPSMPSEALRSPWVAHQLSGLGKSQPSVIVPPASELGLTRRLVCALNVEEAPAGYLEVVEVGQRLTTIDLKVAEQGATVLSLQLLSERRAAAAEGRAKEEFFNDLLHGARDPHTLARRAPLFGIDLSQGHVVIRVAQESTDDGRSASERRALLGDAIARKLDVGCRMAITLPGADVFLFGPVSNGGDGAVLEQVRRSVEAAFEALRGIVPARRAGVSQVCRSASDYRFVHRQLCNALELTEAYGWASGVVLPTDLGMLRLLLSDGQRTESVRFANELLGPLIAHDRAHDGCFVETLRAFLASGGHVRAAAAALSVHENTIRYRLSRIREISAIDPENLDDLLDARFALQVLDVCRGPVGDLCIPGAGAVWSDLEDAAEGTGEFEGQATQR